MANVGINGVPYAIAQHRKANETAVVLWDESRGNGHSVYRIGKPLDVSDDAINFAELDDKRNVLVANGTVSVHDDHDHVHIFGKTHDEQSEFEFRFVIENRVGGQVIGEIISIENGQKLSGSITQPGMDAAMPLGLNHLNGLLSSRDNIIVVQMRDGSVLLNLGTLDELLIDCGVMETSGVEYGTFRYGDTVKVCATGPATALVDPPENTPFRYDPFEFNSIATLKVSELGLHFKTRWEQNSFHQVLRMAMLPRLLPRVPL